MLASRVSGERRGTVDVERRSPAILLVELVAHVFRKLLEFVLAVNVVGVDDEVLEALAALEVASDFCCGTGNDDNKRNKVGMMKKETRKGKRVHTFHALVRESVSPKLEKGMDRNGRGRVGGDDEDGDDG